MVSETRRLESEGKLAGWELLAAFNVSALGLAAYGVGFASQLVRAALFGAGEEMDAWLAASVVPNVLAAVLVAKMPFALVPTLAERARYGRSAESKEVASSLFWLYLGVFAVLAGAGACLGRGLLHLATPGLSAGSLALGTKLGWFLWLSFVGGGTFAVLAAILQTYKRFTSPAVVPLLAAVVNLAALVALAPWLGIWGFAIAGTGSTVLQTTLMLWVGRREGCLRLAFDIRDPGLRRVVRLQLPFIVCGILSQCSLLVDRHAASWLTGGSISRLAYALGIAGPIGSLVSNGIATVLLPKLARQVADGDRGAVAATYRQSLLLVWMLIAPIAAVGACVAVPLVRVLLVHGRFTVFDAVAVGGLLRVYLFSLVAGTVGNVTGRMFYAHGDTLTPSIVGVFEGLAYIVYTPLMARRFGAEGIAWACVLQGSLSIAWQIVLIERRWPAFRTPSHLRPFAGTALAASAGGFAALVAARMFGGALSQVLGGAFAGTIAYLTVLRACGLLDREWFRSFLGRSSMPLGSGGPRDLQR